VSKNPSPSARIRAKGLDHLIALRKHSIQAELSEYRITDGIGRMY
jgi:hypothetical protein